MLKRLLYTLLIVVAFNKSYSQQTAYTFPLPQNWGTEKLNFPIDFAPKIPFTGIEELRFTPGWNDEKSDEYWSYAFLWFIDGNQTVNSDILQNYLTQYFNGLYTSNTKGKTGSIPANFTQVKIKRAISLPGDQEIYEGTIATLNFLTGRTINFCVRIRSRDLSKIGHTAILFEISPKDFQQPVWNELDAVVSNFKPGQ